MEYPKLILDLVDSLRQFSGVGQKSALRMIFQLLGWEREEVFLLAELLNRLREEIGSCPVCFNLSEQGALCLICSNPKRDKRIICVVANARELFALERTKQFKGMYHVLQGLISPMDGVGPEKLKIQELLGRIDETTEELLLALSPSTEGEATCLYLRRLITNSGKSLRVTRLSYGMAMGGDIEATDELTLSKALEWRRELA